MKNSGQIVLFEFPQTDQLQGKLHPELMLKNVPGPYNDVLMCMISTQLNRGIKGFNDILHCDDEDFVSSGLKKTSLIRLGRLAVVDRDILVGSIGTISNKRLKRLKNRLINWIEK